MADPKFDEEAFRAKLIAGGIEASAASEVAARTARSRRTLAPHDRRVSQARQRHWGRGVAGAFRAGGRRARE
ncbi:MAG: hypothetical protein VB124_05460 [Burkholderia sp.]